MDRRDVPAKRQASDSAAAGMREHAATIARLVAEMEPLTEAEIADLRVIFAPAVAAVLDKRPPDGSSPAASE